MSTMVKIWGVFRENTTFSNQLNAWFNFKKIDPGHCVAADNYTILVHELIKGRSLKMQ